MKKASIKSVALLWIVTVIAVMVAGCGPISEPDSNVTNYDKSMDAATGKWMLLDEADTYFLFDGTEDVMTFGYYEGGALKYSGTFRSVYRSNANASTPLTFILTRSDKENKDWINCYTENLEASFTQFSITCAEEDLGVTDGTVYTHIYRLSEMPYKPGTYVLEGKEYQPYEKPAFEETYYIPEGRYVSENGESITVFPVMHRGYSLFAYTNGETVVEGIFNIAADRSTLYLYIENDIYEKIRNADKAQYDTTLSMYYPPDFYLRGSFDTPDNSLVINGLYHHTYSPTEIQDSVWAFGTYVKQ